MADIEITDVASLAAWLKTRPRRDAEIIAFRAAARVFPLWGRAMEEEWAVEHAFGLFPAQRMMLCLHANLLASDQDLQNSLTFATDQAQQNYDAADFHSPHLSIAEAMASMGRLGRSDFKGAIRRAIEAEHEAAAYVERGYWEARYVETHDSSAVEGAVHLDADQARIGNKLLRAPLWPTPAPDWFTTADRETRAIWAKDPPTWAFWEKWWDGVISGEMPFAPELLRDVALIEDDIWQAGPRAVAAAIAQIEKIHDLRAQLAALTQAMEDEDLTQVQRGATLAHRGHNNPPEMIEALVIVQSSAVEIAQAMDDVREELAKPAPEPKILKSIGAGLLAAISKALVYCGGHADTFLQGFAAEMGKQAAKRLMILLGSKELLSMLTAFAKNLQIWPF